MAQAQVKAPLKFGTSFTPHMVWSRYQEGKGWEALELEETRAFPLMPAAAVLHYGQAIFEGIKARRNPQEAVTLFRAEQNAARFRRSARRLAMPEVPEEMFLRALRLLLEKDGHMTPNLPGSGLYLRPYLFAEEAFLGVRPAHSYIFAVIASPMESYFSEKDRPLKLWIARSSRAAPGGTGDVKAAGNYAASFTAQIEAKKQGCDQALFLDACAQQYVEEAGAMNVMFVKKDGSILTPPLNGTILPGITRDSILTLGRDQGMEVQETPLLIDEVFGAGKIGDITEAFSSGTAVGLLPIGGLARCDESGEREEVSFQGAEKSFPVTTRLAKLLSDIQEGRAEDPYEWVKVYA